MYVCNIEEQCQGIIPVPLGFKTGDTKVVSPKWPESAFDKKKLKVGVDPSHKDQIDNMGW